MECAVNPGHAVPNIVMIVNHDRRSYEDDFAEAMTGRVSGYRVTEKTVRDRVPEIDAYVWLDRKPGAQQAEKPRRHFRHGNPVEEQARELLQLD